MEMVSMNNLNLAWSAQPLPVVLERWTYTKGLYHLFFLGASTPSARSPGDPVRAQDVSKRLELLSLQCSSPLIHPFLSRSWAILLVREPER